MCSNGSSNLMEKTQKIRLKNRVEISWRAYFLVVINPVLLVLAIMVENLTKVNLSNLDKVLFPKIGITKARLIEYYIIPTEQEIDQLIAGCGEKTAALLQTLKETAIRVGEAWRLKWIDIDYVNSTVRITPEKGSHARQFKVSSKLLAMITMLPKKSDKIFGTYDIRGYRTSFTRQRKRTANKLQNQRINQITFHTFRHWKATMEYHKTKDILYVMKLLGHKSIKNTLVYTQLIDFPQDDEFVCKVAKTVQEASQLIENGFEYVCSMDYSKLFRKRK